MDKKYPELADVLIEDNKDRNALWDECDNIFYGNWTKPDGMPDWAQPVKTASGHDSVQTATRVMSQWKNLELKLLPMLSDDANRQRANDIEAALKWQLLRGIRRGEGSLLWETAFASVQYAMSVVQVVYLPYQEKIIKSLGKDTKRIKALRKSGDFMFVSHNPSNVYPLWSMYGLEGVLVVKLQKAIEFKKEWGNLAKKVVDKKDDDDVWVTSYDWWDYDRRVVWCVESGEESLTRNEGQDGIEILNEENEFGFIPFSIKQWGNNLSTNSANKVMPHLGTMHTFGLWNIANIYSSLDATLAWKRAAYPVGVHKSPTGEPVELDATEPIGTLEMSSQDEFLPLPPPGVDGNLKSMNKKYEGLIAQATMSTILNTLDFPGRTPSSSVNQQLDAAIGQLAPYKTLIEWTVAEVCHLMLCWVSYYGDKNGGVNLYGEYTSKRKAGTSVLIPSNTIDPEDYRVEAIVTPDIPLDEQARMNTGVLANREFRSLPEAVILESLGYGDPEELFDQRVLEDLRNDAVDLDRQKTAQMQEAEIKLQVQKAQMLIEQAAMQQQQEAQGGAQSTDTQGQPITENTGGLGGNPAAGGTPPVQAAPGQGVPNGG